MTAKLSAIAIERKKDEKSEKSDFFNSFSDNVRIGSIVSVFSSNTDFTPSVNAIRKSVA